MVSGVRGLLGLGIPGAAGDRSPPPKYGFYIDDPNVSIRSYETHMDCAICVFSLYKVYQFICQSVACGVSWLSSRVSLCNFLSVCLISNRARLIREPFTWASDEQAKRTKGT
jgi:hypothetical protein